MPHTGLCMGQAHSFRIRHEIEEFGAGLPGVCAFPCARLCNPREIFSPSRSDRGRSSVILHAIDSIPTHAHPGTIMLHSAGHLISAALPSITLAAVLAASAASSAAPPWDPVLGPSHPYEISGATFTTGISNVGIGLEAALLADEVISTASAFPEVWRHTSRDGWTKSQNLTPFGTAVAATPVSEFFGKGVAASNSWAFVTHTNLTV